MNKLFKPLALLGLALTLLPSLLLLLGAIDLGLSKTLMIVGMVFWYLGATPWIGLASPKEDLGEKHNPSI
ncbi:hypothetical protein [Roseibacillus persicicus]|uniref:Uncharacterized protein n=1 Tax=Roseibacillus persicicus TaxID=454148 RepID=A0A918TLT8_9BACT|nr:hypothetical protein [Roseibacillus persicicus]MDQ8188968.1 hypothetical protein [Roseibacillus persicicus]GHC53276.1 hypothetical protein GCM10007100_19690 [Roseibacillus persicicus]